MDKPLGLVAGLGELPVAIAQNAVAEGRGVYVLRLKGFEEPALAEYPGRSVGLGEFGGLLKSLKQAGCSDVVFAGIVTRPDFRKLNLDMRGARLLPKVIQAARKGDDALLRVLVDTLESEGFNVISAQAANADLLAPKGLLAGPSPRSEDFADIQRAAEIAAATGALDIGQGCVVCDGLVLAVEAQEGTDAMLERVAGLPAEIRGTDAARRGVLVKRPKPMQERRIDLPTTGVSTVEKVAAAGLAGLAIEAGGALMLGRKAMCEAAERLGVFIFGFAPDDDFK